ncbi:sialidase-like [Copidosoma floridanum]|uniref:sialidase-like n=1 Tax=Copidosoma floridanum TaxID=29053 RepID=UPI0006C9A70D|nr:sialidase-like [Copidosoma floridanum]
MFSILATVLLMAVVSAESSSVRIYSSNPSGLMRDYEYHGNGYVAAKPVSSYADIGSGGSPYAKIDSRYSTDSTSDSADLRATSANGGSSSTGGAGSTGGSFYKSKYGSEAVVNSLRPTYPAGSSSSSGSSSSGDPSSPGQQVQYSSVDYTANAASGAPSSSSSASSGDYSSNGGFSGSYGDRSQEFHQGHQQPHPSYSSGAGDLEYHQQSRPASYLGNYAGSPGLPEYAPSRPTSYSHGGLSGSVSSSLSVADYPGSSSSGHRHHPTTSSGFSLPEDYSSGGIIHGQAHGQPPLPPMMPYMKTYLMSSGPSSSSSYPSKYQSVFGAIKSLFSDASTSASHLPPSASSLIAAASSPSSPSGYYSAGAPHAPVASPSGYYLSSGAGPSSLGYTKSYPSMRLVSSYGATGNTGMGGKIIVVRESPAGGHSPSYHPSSGAGLALGSGPSYPVKASRVSAFASAPSGHPAYVSGAPSSMSYTHSYPGSYSSASSFSGGHGGSPFLGYSA